jgi:hypothetical protein
MPFKGQFIKPRGQENDSRWKQLDRTMVKPLRQSNQGFQRYAIAGPFTSSTGILGTRANDRKKDNFFAANVGIWFIFSINDRVRTSVSRSF